MKRMAPAGNCPLVLEDEAEEIFHNRAYIQTVTGSTREMMRVTRADLIQGADEWKQRLCKSTQRKLVI